MNDQHPYQLTWAAASARRLERHVLAATTAQRPEQAVAAMCRAVGRAAARHRHRSDVRDCLWSRHRLVKTFGPRGVLEVVPTLTIGPVTVGPHA